MINKIKLDNKDVFFKNVNTQRAINPAQYDLHNICWNPNKKVKDSPIRAFMLRNISSYIKESTNKKER